MSRSSPRLLVACADPALLNDIVAFFEETAGWQLVVPASSATEAERIIEEEQLDGIVCVEDLLGAAFAAGATAPVIAVSRSESSTLLREALRIGVRGFVRWPQERRELVRIASSLIGTRSSSPVGQVVALWGPKGGSGTSVLAAHLAAAIAGHDKRCVLVDLDIAHGDQASILGAESHQRGLLDLVRVLDEMSPRVLESLSFAHASGFRAVLAPGKLGDSELAKSPDLTRMVSSLTEVSDQVVVDVGSGTSERSLELCIAAHQVLVVVTPDVLALRRARDAVVVLRQAIGDPGAIKLIVNCSSGSLDISPQQASAVVGVPLAADIKEELGLWRSPGVGELSVRGVRLLDPLARMVCGLPPTPRRRQLLRRG